jgi:hypothetical protein
MSTHTTNALETTDAIEPTDTIETTNALETTDAIETTDAVGVQYLSRKRHRSPDGEDGEVEEGEVVEDELEEGEIPPSPRDGKENRVHYRPSAPSFDPRPLALSRQNTIFRV